MLMSFSGVSRYILSNINPPEVRDDPRVLDSIGYLPPGDFGKSDVFMMEKEFVEDFHVVLSFVDNSFISIEADECSVSHIENIVKSVV